MTRPRLRVALTTDAVGGVWTYALDLASGLLSEGIATTLLVLGPAPSPEQLAAAQQVPGLDLLVLPAPLDWTARASDEVRATARVIARAAAATGADLLHVHAAALADPDVALPVVVSCHSCVATWWSAVRGGELPADFAWRAVLAREGLSRAELVIAPTRAFARATASTYGLARVPVVVPNGRTPLKPPRQLPARLTAALTAGRLWDEGKNLAALDRIAPRLPWPILAAGPLAGPHGASVSPEHVRTLGNLAPGVLARWMRSVPAFVSMARYEPFGLAVLEAAQAGAALVLADIPTFRELWEGAALFVPLDDDDALTAALDGLLGDRAAATRLGTAASARAARYTAERMVAETAAQYRSVLQRTQTAPLRTEVAA